MATNLAPKLAFNPGNILDMIDVPVRQEQKFRLNLKRARPFASALGRVEQNPSLPRLKQIAIRFENAAAKAFVIHCDSLQPGLLRLKR
jgi:hypothetical protein